MKTDDGLVAEAQQGRAEAFDELMRRYQRMVCKVAMNYVRERQNALDVTQNVFLKAYQNLDSVQAEGMFKPWLLRISYNESINWLRKNKRHEADDEEKLERTAAGGVDQEAAVEQKEKQLRLLSCLDALNPKYRLAVALRYAEGMRIREIADVMECSQGMVKSLLFRGVRKLRDQVARSA